MSNDSKNKLVVDPERIKMLESALKDFHVFFSDISGRARAVEMFKHQFRKYYFVMPPAWRVG